ncbi:MAG: 23S rRNA-specific endonuclease VapC20 [Deltaproteobacteria bacterium]|jgi:predicted nucleic acid-binding protein|nr:23S rRNA-specific endonuclease VapC20 [Deltaproteobacteria bacterium]
MKSLFLDTSYLIALEAHDDLHHNSSQVHWKALIADMQPLVTSTWIFDEVVTFFNTRNKHGKAVEIGNRLLQSSLVTMVPVDSILFRKGWEVFKQYDDKSFSLTDCISFVIMRDREITEVLTLNS